MLTWDRAAFRPPESTARSPRGMPASSLVIRSRSAGRAARGCAPSRGHVSRVVPLAPFLPGLMSLFELLSTPGAFERSVPRQGCDGAPFPSGPNPLLAVAISCSRCLSSLI